ncbi:MAG: hypothetical protein E7619_02850 [Ruminococcaceae bacterium]|nr:hypothetical protein [Oscillospiraceae bacterium]
MAENTKPLFMEYMNKALVREGNNICYGNMSDKAVLFLLITSFKKLGKHDIPDKILIQIISTDTSLPFHKRILKQGEKNGLYEAFDIGMAWLNRQNS